MTKFLTCKLLTDLFNISEHLGSFIGLCISTHLSISNIISTRVILADTTIRLIMRSRTTSNLLLFRFFNVRVKSPNSGLALRTDAHLRRSTFRWMICIIIIYKGQICRLIVRYRSGREAIARICLLVYKSQLCTIIFIWMIELLVVVRLSIDGKLSG